MYVQIRPFLICNGIQFNETGVCSSRGICISDDICNCTSTDYFGDWCELTTCNGIQSNLTSTVCGGHGICFDFDDCNCELGYLPSQPMVCDIWTCNGVPYTDPTSCTNTWGNCTDLNTCECTSPNYFGDLCDITSCAGTQSNVTTGPSAVCSGHGTCVDYNLCDCTGGYYSAVPDLCENWNCSGIVMSQSNDTCSGRGSCDFPETCVCDEPQFWGGNDCEFPRCYLLTESQGACSGHGTCDSPDYCNCESGYDSLNCGLWTCFGEYSNTSDSCNYDHGDCVALNTCDCNSGFEGDDCTGQYFICNGYRSNETSLACSGQGRCTAQQTCTCNFLYFGRWCEDSTFIWVVLPFGLIIIGLVIASIVLMIAIIIVARVIGVKKKEQLPNDLRDEDDKLLQLLVDSDNEKYFENFVRGGVMYKHMHVLFSKKKERKDIWGKLISEKVDRRRFYKILKSHLKKEGLKKKIRSKKLEMEILSQNDIPEQKKDGDHDKKNTPLLDKEEIELEEKISDDDEKGNLLEKQNKKSDDKKKNDSDSD